MYFTFLLCKWEESLFNNLGFSVQKKKRNFLLFKQCNKGFQFHASRIWSMLIYGIIIRKICIPILVDKFLIQINWYHLSVWHCIWKTSVEMDVYHHRKLGNHKHYRPQNFKLIQIELCNQFFTTLQTEIWNFTQNNSRTPTRNKWPL